jgi:hypothetical protein
MTPPQLTNVIIFERYVNAGAPFGQLLITFVSEGGA